MLKNFIIQINKIVSIELFHKTNGELLFPQLYFRMNPNVTLFRVTQ
ncbi:hypothetical protein LEP1GSC021_0963 [Leptospira noguchii str. 1993005606]|nr:hypothetical protein LEP1GSC021_0963 [Leptospira noguchii str. 1993005606]